MSKLRQNITVGLSAMTLSIIALSVSAVNGQQMVKEKDMVAAMMSKKVLNQLRSNPNAADISIDHRRRLMAQTTPCGIPMVQANQLTQNNQSARKVCIIDIGFNLGHPDLGDQNNGVTGQGNNNQVDNWFNDENGHGTHVAGTIFALANNEGGCLGLSRC